jgi:hypothetical protein
MIKNKKIKSKKRNPKNPFAYGKGVFGVAWSKVWILGSLGLKFEVLGVHGSKSCLSGSLDLAAFLSLA